ncbi:hypothetical protein [Xenorhabdus nematophila]|uniref:hypothetical protein n=1 Tax=Xenorhabdus nematophila TaxID=628 RepID=UPI000A7F7191|nr:hypothetical protein [Xenorhabdus nematophila]
MKSNDFEWFHRPAWQQLLWQQLVIILLLVGFYFGVWQENQHEIDALRSSITERQYHTAQSQQHIKERPSLSDIQQQIQHIKRELDQDSNISSKGISSKNAPPQKYQCAQTTVFPPSPFRQSAYRMEKSQRKQSGFLAHRIVTQLRSVSLFLERNSAIAATIAD